MIFKRIESEGLAHYSYFIGSGKSSVVIDPRRDCDIYLDLADRNNQEICYIFETHRNEDYVIGSLELADRTGAKIYHGSKLNFEYGNTVLEKQEFIFGELKINALETPGHTYESISYVVSEIKPGSKPIILFSGDTLFFGDVGRIDLYGLDESPKMAKRLYNSIFGKMFGLGDDVALFPAHGAGSVCGGAISKRKNGTIGLERSTNPMLQKTEKEFIQLKLAEVFERPPYFRKMEEYNLKGAPLLKDLPEVKLLTPEEFELENQNGAMIIDTRSYIEFAEQHIHNSINIWVDGISNYAGWVIPYEKHIILILDNNELLNKVLTFFRRIGYDSIIGYLDGGLNSWINEGRIIEKIPLITVQDLKKKIEYGEELRIVDVRRDKEWKSVHIRGSENIFVGQINNENIPLDESIAIICSVGNRSGLAASILKKRGAKKLSIVKGSMETWVRYEYPIERLE